MYECPNCGGNLRYDIPSKMMACASCDSKFDPYEVSERNGAQETEDEYEVTVFKCPQCGGDLQHRQHGGRLLHLLRIGSDTGEPSS